MDEGRVKKWMEGGESMKWRRIGLRNRMEGGEEG